MSKLVVENLSKRFSEQQVLKELNFHVDAHEIVSIIGPSGVGKSTLFHMIAGLLTPSSGNIRLDNHSIINQPGNVSYMLQKDLLLPYKTIEKNIALPLILKGEKKKIALEKARQLLIEFDLASVAKSYPKELSGGMRQRVALLRTYLFSANVILLDEPFSALDHFTKKDIHEWYLRIHAQLKLTTLFITHDIDEAIKLSNRIYLLKGPEQRDFEAITIDQTAKVSVDFELSETFLSYKRTIMHCLAQ